MLAVLLNVFILCLYKSSILQNLKTCFNAFILQAFVVAARTDTKFRKVYCIIFYSITGTIWVFFSQKLNLNLNFISGFSPLFLPSCTGTPASRPPVTPTKDVLSLYKFNTLLSTSLVSSFSGIFWGNPPPVLRASFFSFVKFLFAVFFNTFHFPFNSVTVRLALPAAFTSLVIFSQIFAFLLFDS